MRSIEEWHAYLEKGRGADVLRRLERSGVEPRDFLAGLYGKLLRFSDSLDTIEGWLDGRVPSDLGVAVSARGVVARRGQLALESLDSVIEAESRL